jgi:hypothetical protein
VIVIPRESGLLSGENKGVSCFFEDILIIHLKVRNEVEGKKYGLPRR